MEGGKRDMWSVTSSSLDRLAELERLASGRALTAAEIDDYRWLVWERDERVAAWVAGLPVPEKRRLKRRR